MAVNKFTNVNETTSYTGVQPVLNSLRKTNAGATLKQVRQQLSGLDSYTKHRFFKRRFPRLHVWAPYQGYRVELDLLSMEHFAADNGGVKFLLNVIDQFSRFAFSEPLLSKSPKDVQKSFAKICSKCPFTIQSIYADDGKEWKGEMGRFLDEKNIKIIVATSWVKASIIERFQKTLKLRIVKYMRQQHSYEYVSALPNIVNNINNSVNRTLQMAPASIQFSNQHVLYNRLYRPQRKAHSKFKRASAMFEVGDDVIVGLKNTIYKRGYEQNYSDEVFKVEAILPTTPITYRIKDRKDRLLPRKYYQRELQRVRFDQHYLYDFEVRTPKAKPRRNKVLVHFLTEPDDKEEWIDKSTIEYHDTHNQFGISSRKRK